MFFILSSDDPSGNDVWSADDQIYILDLAADEWLDTGFSGALHFMILYFLRF